MAGTSCSFMVDTGTSRHHAYSRKQKSLGLLCANFLSLYNREDVELIGLDEAASRLGVERRRIYDIVNVLESVGVLARKGKNQYTWKGFAGIPQALQNLREEATRGGKWKSSCYNDTIVTSTSSIEDAAKVSDDDDEENFYEDDEDDDPIPDGYRKRSQSCSEPLPMITCSSSILPSSKTKLDCRREKSLGLLTQNFVKLFLSTDANLVSLDEAARLLLGDAPESSQLRTKVRRLYDIANVLSSVNLIEKTHHTETRKPAFRWLGLKGKPSPANNNNNNDNNANTVSVENSSIMDMPSKVEHKKKREFGTDITNNNDFKRNKVVSVVQAKPEDKDNPPPMRDLNDINTHQHHGQKQQQHSSSKSYVFGPFHPVRLPPRATNQEKENGAKKVQDWESLASSYRPQYQNQGLFCADCLHGLPENGYGYLYTGY